MKLIEALEGLEMKEGDDFPQGDKLLRKEDHQAFLREFIFDDPGRQAQDPGGRPEGEDVVPARLQVRLRRDRELEPGWRPGRRRPGRAASRSSAPRASPCGSAGSPRSTTSPSPCRRGEIRAIIGPNGAGKVDVLQLPDRRAPAHAGAASCSTARTSPGCRPHRISRKSLARSYQITNILPGATVLENVRIAAQSRHHAWSLLRHHRAYADVIERARAVLDVGRPRATRRTSWPPTSRTASSATSRSASRWPPSPSSCASTSRRPA